MQERLKVENVVVSRGRRPHVFLHSKTSGTAARHYGPAAAGYRSGHLGFELMQVVRRCAVDGDLPRLHGLGDLPDQFDLEQAIVERRALDLDVVGQVELPLERPGRDAAIEVVAFGLVGLLPSIVTTFCSAVTEISSGEKPATASEIW